MFLNGFASAPNNDNFLGMASIRAILKQTSKCLDLRESLRYPVMLEDKSSKEEQT